MYKTLNKIDTTFFELAQGDVVTAEMWNNLNRFYINQGNDVVDVVNILQTDITRLEERYKHIGIYYGEGEAPSWAYLQIVPTGDEGISLITWRDALDRLEQATDSVQTALESGALVGPRGEKGDKGDKGDMPEVDQVYDSTSANPQSGIALSPVLGAIIGEIADARVDNFGNTSSSLGDNVRWMHHDLDSRKANADHEHSAEHIAIPAGIPHEQANENVYGALWSLNEEKSNKQEVANALKGTASGSALVLNDVSPVEHTMGVKVRGKNLFDKSIPLNTWEVFGGGYYRLRITVPIGSQITASVLKKYAIDEKEGKLYVTISEKHCWLFNESNSSLCKKSGTATATDGTVFVKCTAEGYNSLKDELMIEINSEATDYMPGISDYTAVPGLYIKYLFNHRCVFTEEDLNQYYWAPIYVDKTFEPVEGKTYHVEISNSAERLEGAPEAYNATGTCTATANDIGGYTLELGGNIRIETCSEGHGETWTNSFKITYMQAPSTAAFDLKIGEKDDDVTRAVKLIKTNADGTVSEEYTPTADGTVNGVTSLYPCTKLSTDTKDIVIECAYNRDINKAFEELQQAIISLGGTV